MDHISGNTFFRAFSVVSAPEESDLARTVGNYPNTPCTKVVNGLVGVLTSGVGYGILYMVEDGCNVIPKMQEFRQAAVQLHRTIVDSPEQRGMGAEVSVRTRGGREIKFCETADSVQIVDADGNVSELPGLTIEGISVKLAADFMANYAAYLPYALTQNLLPADSSLSFAENPDVVSHTEALDSQFAPLTRSESTRVTQCQALQAFVLTATHFLSREGQQRFSADVANFLTGNVNHLPAGLAAPNPDIPGDVKQQLRHWLRLLENETPEDNFEKIRVLGDELFRDDVDHHFSPLGSVLTPSEAALNDGISLGSSVSSGWHPWA